MHHADIVYPTFACDCVFHDGIPWQLRRFILLVLASFLFFSLFLTLQNHQKYSAALQKLGTTWPAWSCGLILWRGMKVRSQILCSPASIGCPLGRLALYLHDVNMCRIVTMGHVFVGLQKWGTILTAVGSYGASLDLSPGSRLPHEHRVCASWRT
jgi:hypothetical protein